MGGVQPKRRSIEEFVLKFDIVKGEYESPEAEDLDEFEEDMEKAKTKLQQEKNFFLGLFGPEILKKMQERDKARAEGRPEKTQKATKPLPSKVRNFGQMAERLSKMGGKRPILERKPIVAKPVVKKPKPPKRKG